jgi:hypothetical protein
MKTLEEKVFSLHKKLDAIIRAEKLRQTNDAMMFFESEKTESQNIVSSCVKAKQMLNTFNC